jgi:hypothetical protein
LQRVRKRLASHYSIDEGKMTTEMKYMGPAPDVGEVFPRFGAGGAKRYYRIIDWKYDPDRKFHYEYILTVEEVEDADI